MRNLILPVLHMSTLIPFIHNYCDRWCERCYMTARCAVYESLDELTPEQKDIHNKAFWDHLSNQLQESISLLHTWAREHGVEDRGTPSDKEHEIERALERELHQLHPIVHLSLQYADQVSAWLKIHADELLSTHAVTPPSGRTEVKDCIEIVQWYEIFIHVKLMRAISGLHEKKQSKNKPHGFLDAEGSAKIALIAIERSMQAWHRLLNYIPGQEEDILNFLLQLKKISVLTEELFPDARNFVRPGFDEG